MDKLALHIKFMILLAMNLWLEKYRKGSLLSKKLKKKHKQESSLLLTHTFLPNIIDGQLVNHRLMLLHQFSILLLHIIF